MQQFSRRELITAATSTAAALAATATALPIARAAESGGNYPPMQIGLNTAPLRGQKLPLAETVELAGKAGYQGLEPWIDELEAHQRSGSSLKDLGKRIHDLGLTVVSAIGFA